MKILQSRPDTAKINGEPVKGNLLKIKKSVIRVDKFLKKDLTKSQRESEKLRKNIEKSSRLKKEKRIESKDDNTKKSFAGKVRVPSLGIFGSLKKFISTVVLGFFAIKLIPLLPKLIPIAVGLGKFVNFIITIGGRFLNGFISLVDFGVRAGDATIGFIKQIGGEKTAEIFSKFGGAITGLIDAALLIGVLSLQESGQDFMFDQKNRKPKGPKGRGPLKGVKKSLRRKSLKTFGRGATKTLGKFGKGGPLAAIFTLFDFMGRKSEGQSNLQAGLGSGASLGGFAAGAKAGAAIGTVVAPGIGTAIGGLIGGVIGASLGSGIADKISGANKIKGRNEGGLVKGKGIESDRFKQDDKLKLPSTKISPLVLSDVGKKIFPNNVEYLPKSGDTIEKSFDLSTNGILGPIIGVSYKMLVGQQITANDSQVVSDYLKVGSKLGFKPEDIQKGLSEKSSKVKGNLESESRVEEIAGPETGYPLTKFLLNLSKTKDPKSGGVQLFYKNEVDSIRNMLETIFKIAAALGIITASVAAFTVGLPALVGVLTKIAAPVVTSGPTLIARIFQSAAPAATKLARGVSQGVATGVRQAAARGARKVGMTNVTRAAKDQVVDTTARTIIKKPIRTARTIIKKPIRFEQQVLDLTAKKPTIPTGQLSLSKKILQPKTFAKSVKEASVPRPATNIEKTFDRLTTVRPTKGGFERSNRPTNLKLDIKSDIPDPFSTGPIRKGVDVLDIFKKPISKKPVTTNKQLKINLNKPQEVIKKGFDEITGFGRFSRFSKPIENIGRKKQDIRFETEKIKKLGKDGFGKFSKDQRSKINEALRNMDTRDTDALMDAAQNTVGGNLAKTNVLRSTLESLAEQLGISTENLLKILQEAKKQVPMPKVNKFNLGGFVRGAGGTDMIPARLTSGEFVIDKDSTDYLRATMPGFLAGINKAKYDDVLPVLQSYASYENGFGGQDIVVVAPTTEINNMSGQQVASAPMINAGGSEEDPFEILAKG